MALLEAIELEASERAGGSRGIGGDSWRLEGGGCDRKGRRFKEWGF